MSGMKKSELREAVRQVIREELAELLPMLMREVLTEAYLKRLVTEQTGPRRPVPNNGRRQQEFRNAGAGLREAVFGEDEEEESIPSPQENDDHGIYQDEAMLASNKNEAKENKAGLLSRSNPLAFIYEDVDTSAPMTASPGTQIPSMIAPPSGPIPTNEGRKPQRGFDLEHMRKIIKVGESKLKKDPAQLAAEAEFQAQQIKRRREMLDVPVNVKG